MKRIRSHTVALTYEKNNKFKFKPNTKEIKKNVVFLLNLISDSPTEVSIRFCDTQEMLRVNGKFRHKNKTTDVLSFLPDRSYNQNVHFLGDILICVPVCIQQAKHAKHSLSAELLKMLTHALLHLKGFDHERNQNAEIVMSKLERSLKLELKKKFGQPNFGSVTRQQNIEKEIF